MDLSVFRSLLAAQGLKLTRERVSVMREIASVQGHFDPELLYGRIRSAGGKTSRASVYRTLGLLLESGVVKKVSRTDRGSVYELSSGAGHHDHMVCDSCGAVIEFFSEEFETLRGALCREKGFYGTSHAIEIRGHCEGCGEEKG